MLDSMLKFWLIFGGVLVLSELLLPGLVSVFVGLGALTVAGLLHFQLIDGLPAQVITWIVSSTVYIFSLRLIVIRFYPSDREKRSIDEDQVMAGHIATVTEEISKQKPGRIMYGELTWAATLDGDESVTVGEEVELVSRENISWRVRKISK